ncbi:MAG: ATP-binding protein [Candidatus Omnitrophica bacterium]|nr:ATP-binding protein [Candidatus Omnitrophota bacterium]
MLYFLAYSGLLSGIAAIIFGLFVYLKDRRSAVNKSYALLSLSIAIWGLAYYFWPLADNKKQALISFQILHMGSILIAPSFLWFSLSLLDLHKKFKKLIVFSYILSVFFIMIDPTVFFIKDMIPMYIFRYWAIPGIAYHFYLIFWFICVLFAWFCVIKQFKYLTKTKQNQMKYVFIASVLGFLGGSTNYFLWYKISIPPIATILVGVHIVIIAYAVVRHQLMDIEIVIKKSLVFAGMFIFSFGIFVAITLIVSHLFGRGGILSLAVSSLIIVIGLRPLEILLVNTTDKFLFQKKYEYKQILKKFIDDVITVLNLDEVVNSTLKLLDESLHPYTASIFILNRADDKYNLYGSSGLENKDIAFTSESKLVYFLKKTHNPAVIKQADGIKGVDSPIVLEMQNLKAVLVLPFLLHDDLIGFIALGRKRSDEDYTKDDLDVLQDLARTESIAVGNAQLITEAAQGERRAAIGTMAAGINHEIGNPLNIINTKIQFFLLSSQRGLFQDKTKEEITQECSSILNETIKQTNRISEITRKLSNFAKPSKEFKPELVDILEQVEETLSMIGHDLELEKIQIETNIPPSLYKITADKREIQQIFFNIIRNAAQAIEKSGKIIISAINTVNNKVHIEVRDTGKGIPEDKTRRIFEPFFTTKGANQGTGLGLSIVRQLVWKNKGEISFSSQAGVGTVFVLEFNQGV